MPHRGYFLNIFIALGQNCGAFTPNIYSGATGYEGFADNLPNAVFERGKVAVCGQNLGRADCALSIADGLGSPDTTVSRADGGRAKITGDFGALNEGSTWQLIRRARGSSRNVRTNSP